MSPCACSRSLLVASLAVQLLVSGCLARKTGAEPEAIEPRSDTSGLVAFSGQPAVARPLTPIAIPEHPFMAPNGRNSMHGDAFTSDTYRVAGPVGREPSVTSVSRGVIGGECVTLSFDARGRILAVCVQLRKPALVLLDPHTLKQLAHYPLPRRRNGIVSLRKLAGDTGGGAYFYLDHKDRVVVGNAEGAIEIIQLVESEDAPPRFEQVSRFDVSEVLIRRRPYKASITSVMPDWEGRIWFASRNGVVGTVDPETGVVQSTRLQGEEVQNSFATSPDGVYIVSDHALYRMTSDCEGRPYVLWREGYDRGTRRKLGQINQGSGTTPTLLGDKYVAIANNADPRLEVLVYRREGAPEDRLVCKVPLFKSGASATENTMIGYDHSLIVENNSGYDIFRTMRGGRTADGGVARVDVREDGSGCDLVWESGEVSQTTVPKLSLATGLIYLYTKDPDAPDGVDAFYFTALDFRTGRTVYRVLTGTGTRFDNHWAPITLAPDGAAYVGVLNGLIRIEDRPLAAPGLPEAPRATDSGGYAAAKDSNSNR